MPPALRAAVEAEAEQQRASVGAIVRLALEEHIARGDLTRRIYAAETGEEIVAEEGLHNQAPAPEHVHTWARTGAWKFTKGVIVHQHRCVCEAERWT